MSVHIVFDNTLVTDGVNIPQNLNPNDHDAAEPIPADVPHGTQYLRVNGPVSSRSIAPAVSDNTVDTISNPYTALTNETVEQHQHHYDGTTRGEKPIQRFETSFTYPYQRYNGYDLIVAQANGAGQVTAIEMQRVNSISYANSVSTVTTPMYTGTFSNMSTISYNSTSLDAYQSPSSIQAQPEYEQYTHAPHNDQIDGNWQTQSIGYKQKLAGIGAQFGDTK